jgi:hypothetical protein
MNSPPVVWLPTSALSGGHAACHIRDHRRRSVLKRPPLSTGQRGGRLPDWLPACPPSQAAGAKVVISPRAQPLLETSFGFRRTPDAPHPTRARPRRAIGVLHYSAMTNPRGEIGGDRSGRFTPSKPLVLHPPPKPSEPSPTGSSASPRLPHPPTPLRRTTAWDAEHTLAA